MKYIFTLLLSLVLATNAYATPPQMTAGSYNPQGTLIEIEAHGLVCDFCARAIEKVFLKRAEVSGIAVNLSDHRIVISLKNGQNLDDALLEKLINDAGYTLARISRKEED